MSGLWKHIDKVRLNDRAWQVSCLDFVLLTGDLF